MLYANPSSPVTFHRNSAETASNIGQIESLTPAQVRLQASAWVASGRTSDAELLVTDALKKYPYSEDLLVIRALLSEVGHDWSLALDALERLMALQSGICSVETWSHYVRVLRCMGRDQAAMAAIQEGLQQHPAHPILMHEFTLLLQQAQQDEI